jgi:hypothetical protein
MTHRRASLGLLVILACAGSACQLKRPDVVPTRMIEPQLAASQPAEQHNANAVPVHLLDTQARTHISRRLLHLTPEGELVEDPAWRWTSSPDRYLDSALRFAFASSADLRLVDASDVATLAVTLTAWHLESTNGTQLVGALELVVTTADHAVLTHVIRKVEPVTPKMPGDLAPAAGRLLNRLAAESLAGTAQAVQ